MKTKLLSLIFALIFVVSTVLISGCSSGKTNETTGVSTTKETTVKQTDIESTTESATESATEETTEKTIVIDPNLRKVTLTEKELYDKVYAGWIGELIGVTWFASTEFGYCGRIMPAERVPAWKDTMINAGFDQDDVYIEIPFLMAMYKNGIDCDPQLVTDAFAEADYSTYHANNIGKTNAMKGVMFPYCGNYMYNEHCDDIDWQIDCDYLGMSYPGLVNEAAKKAFEIGHIMNYGDGVYGGVFVSAMRAAAYTATSVEEIVKAGMDVIPDGTLFKDCMNIVWEGYKNGLGWEVVWQQIEDKYGDTDRCATARAGASQPVMNIDAKVNSVYCALGLLYGEEDFEKSVIISGRCGQDSDCNPSTVAGIMASYLGLDKVPEKYYRALSETDTFQGFDITVKQAVDMNFALLKEEAAKNPYIDVNEDNTYTIHVNDVYEQVEFEQWPTDFYVSVCIYRHENNEISINLIEHAGKIKTMHFDMGDGYETDAPVSSYIYKELGVYKVKASFTSTDGDEFEVTQDILISPKNLRMKLTPICSVTNPTGTGNKDLSVICDGVIPEKGSRDKSLQYDTYTGNEETEVWIGVEFEYKGILSSVIFNEGYQNKKGGWFAEIPTIEVLIDGQWVERELDHVHPDYPVEYRKPIEYPFETYEFILNEPVECDGVRLKGKPAGEQTYITCGEFLPIFEYVFFEQGHFEKLSEDVIICNRNAALGSGNKNIGIIRDGFVPVIGMGYSYQYDTYDGTSYPSDVYIGYLFKSSKTLNEVAFTEGAHFEGGGWFDGIRLEVLVNGEWKSADYELSPDYPSGVKASDFGSPYEVYTFKLNSPIDCDGFRIIGKAGGTSRFVSCSELAYKSTTR